MKNIIAATGLLVVTPLTVMASDLNRKAPSPYLNEYSAPLEKSATFGVSGGVIYSTKDKKVYTTVRPQISYNNFVGFAEYGIAQHDKQFAQGGVGYDISLPYDVSVTPNMKAGYHWNNGAFLSPGVVASYNVSRNFSLDARYDYVQYRDGKNDNYLGGGVTFRF